MSCLIGVLNVLIVLIVLIVLNVLIVLIALRVLIVLIALNVLIVLIGRESEGEGREPGVPRVRVHIGAVLRVSGGRGEGGRNDPRES